SRERQSISIDELRLDVHFEAGETIHTENSYKYTDGDIDTLAREGGFDVQQRWRDAGMSFTDVLMVARRECDNTRARSHGRLTGTSVSFAPRAGVAQMVRALGCGPRGRRFDP